MGTTIAVLKNEVEHLKTETERYLTNLQNRVETIFDRVNNGFSKRLTILEQKVEALEASMQSMKSFIVKLIGGLLLAMILGFVTSYVAMQHRNTTMENQLNRLERQMNPP